MDKQELIDLTLEICNIDSAGPHEGLVAEAVHKWLIAEGFEARLAGLLPDRPNVIGTLRGSGGGCSLLFNSHMDTAVQASDVWVHRRPDAPVYHSAWVEGDDLVGEGVVNDKGPMAAFLIAAKAVKSLGVQLPGDLLLTAVVGETSHEPVHGVGGVGESAEGGARFLVTHGGVADYVIVAEGTGFSIVSLEAGMAWFKVTWLSDQVSFYTPYLPDRGDPLASPNMIVRAAAATLALEDWAAEYTRKYTREYGPDLMIPKAQVAAIRGGDPTAPIMSPQICSLYLGAFIPPDLSPLDLRDDFLSALSQAGIPAPEVQLYLYRRGYQASGNDLLRESLLKAHIAVVGTPPPPPNPATSSMWRDINVFSEMGIPALTYGPRSESHSYRRAFPIDALYKAARVYARTIVDVCHQPRTRNTSP